MTTEGCVLQFGLISIQSDREFMLFSEHTSTDANAELDGQMSHLLILRSFWILNIPVKTINLMCWTKKVAQSSLLEV